MSGSVSMVDGHIDPETSRMTNYEKIKAMSVDEMAKMFSRFCGRCDTCDDCIFYKNCPNTHSLDAWKQWLESEVESNDS